MVQEVAVLAKKCCFWGGYGPVQEKKGKMIFTPNTSLCLSGWEAYAQTDPLGTKKTVFQSLSERWELDSSTRRGTFLVTNAGFERGKCVVLLRPRLPDTEGENPAILDNIGRADAMVIYKRGHHLFSVMGSHPLRGGANNRGQIQFDWRFPVTGNLRGNLQSLHVYSETMIDYNHRQTTIELAILLVNGL